MTDMVLSTFRISICGYGTVAIEWQIFLALQIGDRAHFIVGSISDKRGLNLA